MQVLVHWEWDTSQNKVGHSMEEAREVINELLVEIFHRILAIENEGLRQQGVSLSMSEVHVLEAISLVEEPSMTNIAQKIGITVGSLTTAINTLYQKKYVTRKYDPTDRRKVLIALEPIALEALQKHDDFHQRMIDAIFEDLHLAEDEVLIQSLKKVSSYFKKW
jgi:DNA-binding MarR family transcriptional regulator